MAKKTVSFPVMFIKHKGYFDFDKLLKDIKSWFDDNDYDFFAPKHKHKPDEEEVKFTGERKITGYIKFILTVAMRIWEFKEVEVIKEGRKVKTNYGRVALEFTPAYVLDYEERVKAGGILQELQKFYHKYVIKRKIEDYWEDELMRQASGLISVIKKDLKYEAM